jgi:hypothetical protein
MWYLYMIGRLYDFYDGVACCIPLLTGTVYLNVAAKESKLAAASFHSARKMLFGSF